MPHRHRWAQSHHRYQLGRATHDQTARRCGDRPTGGAGVRRFARACRALPADQRGPRRADRGRGCGDPRLRSAYLAARRSTRPADQPIITPRDITERKQADAALRRQNEELTALAHENAHFYTAVQQESVERKQDRGLTLSGQYNAAEVRIGQQRAAFGHILATSCGLRLARSLGYSDLLQLQAARRPTHNSGPRHQESESSRAAYLLEADQRYPRSDADRSRQDRSARRSASTSPP